MDLYRADLHIHSRHSRATSKELAPRRLAAWAQVKGLHLLGTGDFTHPRWLEELSEALAEDGSGFLKLRDPAGLEREVPWLAGFPFRDRTRFILQAEISSIYKRGGKVRKVHSLVYMPSLESVARLNQKLARIGNLASDGRPILGLDARRLLEVVLETDPRGFVIPAHIWTPWFSIFGSKSGFDSVEECYGDLAKEIFALETGLSSDPEMNWLWSKLDRFRLVSNSDAHSGEKLGREANLLAGEMSYDGLLRALKGQGVGSRFLGTVEFFPEEGKYHLDGHRACKVIMEPGETRSRGGICPACGKPLTVGVLSRVVELADRAEPKKPDGHPGFISLIPLAELLAEILDSGVNTKTVRAAYARVVADAGSELTALIDAPADQLERVVPLLGEAVERMRRGKVLRQAGYDGEFGVIHVFTPAEKRDLRRGGLLLPSPPATQAAARSAVAGTPVPEATPKAEGPDSPPPAEPAPALTAEAPGGPSFRFNPAQERAIHAGPGPVLVLAGPGSGKTQTLMGRIRRLIDQGVPARHILAVTFTRRAAGELRERMAQALPPGARAPRADTLHALAFEAWQRSFGEPPLLLDEAAAQRLFAEVNPQLAPKQRPQAWSSVSLAREAVTRPMSNPAAGLSPELAEALENFARQKRAWNLADYTDLLSSWLEQLSLAGSARIFKHLLVDEVQDLTALQLAVLKALAPEDGVGFFAIGDPNQSIYGFRGAAADVRGALEAAWPSLTVAALKDNYRSAPEIVTLAGGLFPKAQRLTPRSAVSGLVQLFAAPDAAAEQAWVAERVRQLLGPTSSTLLAQAEQDGGGLAPGDIAVLVRLRQLAEPLRKALDRLGVPASVPEEEAFWLEPRVGFILRYAGAFLGMATEGDGRPLTPEIPEKVLAKGPPSLAAYLEDIPPFDRFFWKSKPFRQLSEAFLEHGGWAGVLSFVHLQSELDQVRQRAESVQVMTIHAAKGLEFPAVFLPGLEEGLLPFAGAAILSGKGGSLRPMDLDEEKRLFYVGLTRAKRLLHLSHCARRSLYGRELKLSPSRFLKELPEGIIRKFKLVPHTVTQTEHLNLF